MIGEPLRQTCFICGRRFQFSQHTYDGRRISRWDIMICRQCDNGNQDGLNPQGNEKLLEHLKERKTEIKFTSNGFIVIPPNGS